MYVPPQLRNGGGKTSRFGQRSVNMNMNRFGNNNESSRLRPQMQSKFKKLPTNQKPRQNCQGYALVFYRGKYTNYQVKLFMAKKNLTNHGNLNFNANQWVFPGGRIEKNETHKEGILREFKEETGFELKGQFKKIVEIRPTYCPVWNRGERKIYAGFYELSDTEYNNIIGSKPQLIHENTDGAMEMVDVKWSNLKEVTDYFEHKSVPVVDEKLGSSKFTKVEFYGYSAINWHYHILQSFKQWSTDSEKYIYNYKYIPSIKTVIPFDIHPRVWIRQNKYKTVFKTI